MVWLGCGGFSPEPGRLQTGAVGGTIRLGIGGTVIDFGTIAFVALASAYAVYGLYAGAISLRDATGADTSPRSARFGVLADGGIAAAAFGAVALFVTPWFAREGGYPGAAVALIGITVPLAVIFLAVRTWAVARIVGARGMGELLVRTYGSGPAILTGLIVASAATVLMALSLTVAAHLIDTMSAGLIDRAVALHLAALFLLLTGAPAGLHAARRLARLHSGLALVALVCAIGLVVAALGGLDATIASLAAVGSHLGWGTTEGRGGGDYPQALAIAGGIGLGEHWSGTAILSAQIALGGAVLILAWLPRNLASDDPRRFKRQIGLSAFVGGAVLLAATLVLGLAALPLVPTSAAMPAIALFGHPSAGDGVARPLDLSARGPHELIGALFGLGAVAALHALTLSLLAAAIAALKPIWLRRRPDPNEARRALAIGHGVAVAIGIAALLIAYLPIGELVATNAVAISVAPLALLPLAAVAWFPRLGSGALSAGLVAGLATVAAELSFGIAVHMAAFGLAAAVLVAGAASLIGKPDSRFALRRDTLAAIDSVFAGTHDERGADNAVRTWALICVAAWIFFAAGPGAVIGNDLFGAPDLAPARWDFALPSIAVWQVLAWASGAVLVWFCARITGLGAITRDQMDQIGAQKDRQSADR